MLTRSSKSVRSIRSLSSSEINTAASGISQKSNEDEPTSYVFEVLLPFVCKRFQCEFDLYVKKELVQDGRQRPRQMETPVSYKRIGMITPSSIQMPKKTGAAASEASYGRRQFITVNAFYDKNDTLVEISMSNQQQIPRLLMQALVIAAPLYENVIKFTIRRCQINVYTIYELNKLVFLMNLTDVCLDDSFVREANYAILLEKKSPLRQLSLCRCSITDVVCQEICSKLRFPAPAENNLTSLSLSGNRIRDEGAKYIGEMLRSNRSLRYLNLAGNEIEDGGVRYILDALMQFCLTYDEIVEKRRIILTYFKRKHELTRKFMNECDTCTQYFTSTTDLNNVKEPSMRSLKAPIKNKANTTKEKLRMFQNKDQTKEQAELLAVELIGELQGPFSNSNIVLKDGWPYCVGNLALSYLNLSYNNLTYLSTKKVLDVLTYQKNSSNGLFKIIIDGNCMPKACQEYEEISELIKNKVINVAKESSSKRKSLSKISTASSNRK